MSARDNILARLRAAPRSSAPVMPDVAGRLADRYAALRAPEADRFGTFRSAIEAAHAEVHETSGAEWPALVVRLCREKGVAMLACPPAGDLSAALMLEPDAPEIWGYGETMEAVKGRLFDATDAGITRAHGAIAETGTLIAWTGVDEPRSLSLVPPIHFILLDRSRIYADLLQAMTEEGWAGRLPTNLLLISGPSKTADIQQTLAYGAHGPKELIVLVLNPEGVAA
ncbi:MAG: lactate utilization protein [Rhodocyclaceae bacterium]|nr:lactate utilization protein [Rhodocyclaceae bacterium]